MVDNTIRVKAGVWDVKELGNTTKYKYRVCSIFGSSEWSVFRLLKGTTTWQYTESGFDSKYMAIEYARNLMVSDNFNPVEDYLNNIDDGVDINNEGWDH